MKSSDRIERLHVKNNTARSGGSTLPIALALNQLEPGTSIDISLKPYCLLKLRINQCLNLRLCTDPLIRNKLPVNLFNTTLSSQKW